MLTKSFSLLTLIVAIQFSQILAAPSRDGIFQDGDLSQATVNTESPLQQAKDNFVPDNSFDPTEQNLGNLQAPVSAPAAEDGISTQPMQNMIEAGVDAMQSTGEQFGDTMQSANDQVGNVADSVPSIIDETKPEEHLSHMLTREQELKILHQMPEFSDIIKAMEMLPDEIFMEMQQFLTSTVPRMPPGNLFTKHFENAGVLVEMFDRLIRVARTEGAVFSPSSKQLFDRVHRAAPEMKTEMDQFNVLMEDAKSRLANLGTSTNPMNSDAQPPTAGINVTAGSVSLPVGESETFGSEFAPAVESTE